MHLCQKYLELIYQNLNAQKIHDRNHIAQTYGEILYPSVSKLLSILSFLEKDVFIDLGSGLGKLVLQVFLNTSIKEVCGIEIIPELHKQSLLAKNRVQQDFPEFFIDRHLKFLLGDFLETAFSSATIVLIGSPCFSQKMMTMLGNILNQSTNLHTVLSLRPIVNLNQLRFRQAVRLEGSWDSTLCYVYSKNHLSSAI